MLIIPAIDLEAGSVVRYTQGLKDKKVYSRDPLKTATEWQRQGAKLLHLVDLDGAFSGNPKNIRIAKAIARDLKIPIEFGGGIRSIRAIEDLLESGIQRVVLGTRAIEDAGFLSRAFKKFGHRIIVSIDARDGKAMVRGWKSEAKAVAALRFCQYLKGLGFDEIIYTDTSRDGTLKGPNIKETRGILRGTGLKVIASGGVSALGDILKLKKLERYGLSGIIIGKALYEGRFSLSQAIKLT